MIKKLLIYVAILLSGLMSPLRVNASIENWQQGFNYRLNNQTKDKIDAGLIQLKESGANYVSFSPGWLTENEASSNVDRKTGTPSDEILIYAINKSHELGFKVMLKPHVDIANGVWRANIDPFNTDEFFINYNKMILGYAQIAQDTQVEQFSIGAELVKLTINPDNEDEWDSLITKVKEIYHGKLTYSANADDYFPLDEASRLPFWDRLDFVGLSFYRPISDTYSSPVSEMMANWGEWEADYIKPLHDKLQKPFLFSEIGYRSIDGAGLRPWDFTISSTVDYKEQEDLYYSFFEYWKDSPYIYGVNIWEWEPITELNVNKNLNYTPQFKPAENIVKKYFIEGSTTPTQPTSLITNLNKFSTTKADVGTVYYLDRTYTIKSLPSFLMREEIIRTKNSDKFILDNVDQLTFDLTDDATIFVAYDSRQNILPEWLQKFTKTSFKITTSDTTFNLFSYNYSKGSVVLGGNKSLLQKGNLSNYFVLATKNSVDEPSENPTPSPTPSITPEITPSISETPVPSITPTPTPSSDDLSNHKLILVTPEDGALMSGEKKIKVVIESLELNQYTATINIDKKGEIDMPEDATQSYKQVKVQFDELNWNKNGIYPIEIIAKDNNGNKLDKINFTLKVK